MPTKSRQKTVDQVLTLLPMKVDPLNPPLSTMSVPTQFPLVVWWTYEIAIPISTLSILSSAPLSSFHLAHPVDPDLISKRTLLLFYNTVHVRTRPTDLLWWMVVGETHLFES